MQIIELTGDTVLLFECLQGSPLSVSDIHHWTDCDPILAKVRTFVLQRWSSQLAEEEFQLFWHRRHELLVSDHVLLSGSRVIAPQK